jgi:DnaK suppressor protein
MANSKRKPAAKPVAKKKVVTAKPAKKPQVAKKTPARKPAKPAPKKVASAKSAAKSSARKPVKLAKAPRPAPKKAKASGKSAAAAKPVKHAPVKRVSVKQAPIKHAPAKPAKAGKGTRSKATGASKKGKMAVAASKDTITREDGRYALPGTTVINLPAGYHPLAREEYLGPRQLAYFRRKLLKWREDLVEESKQTIDNLREEVRDVGDDAERATRETENSLELRTRDRYRKLIAKIDKALKRIEEGRYGYCEETDEEIGIERLEARPIATLCLDAQERWEHRQKQMGD